MEMTDDGTWTWKPFWEDHWRIVDKTEHESGSGPNAKCPLLRAMSEFEGKAENICSHGVFRILTHMRHQPRCITLYRLRRPLVRDKLPTCLRVALR